MGRYADLYAEFYPAIKSDIYKLCEALNFTPNKHQRKLFDAVMRALRGTGSRLIAAKSGQGVGKTAGSVIVGIFLTLQADNALTILTAPTQRQCRDVWLSEARRILDKADPIMRKLIEVSQTKLTIAGKADWQVRTITASKSENAQGAHHPKMNIIMEEASGIKRDIAEQFLGTASNPGCIILLIGNPNTRDCFFFDCFNRNADRWQTMTFNAEEIQASEWFDPARNDLIAKEFGRDSDVYRIRVLGEFPHQDPNCVLSSMDVEACAAKELLLKCVVKRDINGEQIRRFGLDFSRYGGDESTVFQRSGEAIIDWACFVRQEPMVAVRRAYEMQARMKWDNKRCIYVCDAGGIGQGIMGNLYEDDKEVVEFHNGGKAFDSSTYANRITEAWFNMARKLKNRGCYLPFDRITCEQLAGRRYYTNKDGLLILESKDDYIKRGYDSPDRADGAVLAFSDDGIAGSQIHTGKAA